MSTSIPGYTYGAADLARSPLSLEDLGLIQETLLFTDEDRSALRGVVATRTVEAKRSNEGGSQRPML